MRHASVLFCLLLAGALSPPGAGAAAAEPAKVKVELYDNGSGEGIKLSPDRAKAGAIEFEIANTSKDLPHDFLLVRWPGPEDGLPADRKKGEVEEGELPGLAGIKHLDTGAKVILRLTLEPGAYVAFCDEIGHYAEGMHSRFTVVP
jgi:uncharacterized cupredoxin-like copper-binding protein